MAPPRSSSEEIDALISMETPSAVPRAKSRHLRVKVAHGFEDQPTDVQLPPAFLDDESTQTPKEEAARIAAMVSRAHHPPAPSASGGARRQAPRLAGSGNRR